MRGAYAVVRAEGEIDIAAVPRVRAWVRRAAQRSPSVVVDLRDVEFLDTFALSALILLQEEARVDGWTLHCIAGAAIQRLLDLAEARTALCWIAPEQLTR